MIYVQPYNWVLSDALRDCQLAFKINCSNHCGFRCVAFYNGFLSFENFDLKKTTE